MCEPHPLITLTTCPGIAVPFTYMHAYIHTYLPTYLTTYLCKYIHTYMRIYSKNYFIHNWIIWKSWLTSKLTEVKLALYQAMEAQRGSRSVALLFLNRGTRWGRWSTLVSMNIARCSVFTCRVHTAVKF